jgi:hypothetical protein
MGCCLITSLKVAWPFPPELSAEMVTEFVPMTVGVPLIKPVDLFTLSPVGNPWAL